MKNDLKTPQIFNPSIKCWVRNDKKDSWIEKQLIEILKSNVFITDDKDVWLYCTIDDPYFVPKKVKEKTSYYRYKACKNCENRDWDGRCAEGGEDCPEERGRM